MADVDEPIDDAVSAARANTATLVDSSLTFGPDGKDSFATLLSTILWVAAAVLVVMGSVAAITEGHVVASAHGNVVLAVVEILSIALVLATILGALAFLVDRVEGNAQSLHRVIELLEQHSPTEADERSETT